MEVKFSINGKPYTVDGTTISVNASLNEFIRNYAQLRGTKFMCLEGGCGACIVMQREIHPVTKQPSTYAVNSCLWPLYSCHGLEITTIEGVGNRKDGYHPAQTRLWEMNGTQCGYCSPAMVMTMCSLLEKHNGKVTMQKIENSLDGNICRCTGYRPILDAFKSLAVDADEKLTAACVDIEDLKKVCPRTRVECSGSCHTTSSLLPLHIQFKDKRSEWYKVMDLPSLFDILSRSFDKPYILVAGNTAHGVYRRSEELELFIDVHDVVELRSHRLDDTLVIGGNVSLNEAIQIFTDASETSGFEYCKQLAKHVGKVANLPVRDRGTIAGNLSIKHAHHEFPSDIFLILEGCGATLTIAESETKSSSVPVADYLKMKMTKKVLTNVTLKPLDPSVYKFRTYKIMPRAQNAHAYVNASFLIKFNGDIVESARICFGGINPSFIHATNTERSLQGKNLYTNETLQSTISHLNNEVAPDWVLPDASPEYRKNLAISLFYKFVLNTAPDGIVKAEFKTGGELLERPLSSGRQTFDTYEDKYPLTKPVPKYEGLVQVSGEAKYFNDMPRLNNDLWAAFVPTSKVRAKIGKIDATEALKIPGVRFFFSAKDIPGKNNFSPALHLILPNIVEDEEIFVGQNSEIRFYGQPAGVILADNHRLANLAASKVEIVYVESESVYSLARSLLNPLLGIEAGNVITFQVKFYVQFIGYPFFFQPNLDKQIIPTIKDAYALNAQHRFIDSPSSTKASHYGSNATKKVVGRFEIGGQYHFTMEPQTAYCVPSEDGMDVYTSTQYMDFTNIAIAECLNVRENSINMIVLHVGGGFGSKCTRSSQIACACAVACHLTNQPVRFVMTIESNMTTIGKRFALINEYDVDVDDNGKIQKLKNNYAVDLGCSLNESLDFVTQLSFPNCYLSDTWDYKGQLVQTDATSHTWFRAPGSTEGISMIENIMEHIAREVGKDGISVRLANMADDSNIKTMMPDFLKDIDFKERQNKINEFNKNNRWRKRGIAVVPMKFHIEYFCTLPAFVSIYQYDGSVAISHGGIEMGQGMNTKIVQVAAHVLGIPYDYVKVKPSNNLISANSGVTGGSQTSEAVCFAVKKACEILLARLKPIRDEMKNAKWPDVTKAAHLKSIDLTAKYLFKATDATQYVVWGLSCAEIDTDLLTGNIQLRRVDILEDTGESMSPLIDVGQVEGSFIMGVGYWLTEALVYDRESGELLTNRTWNYKTPGAQDIPVDFRVKFLRKSSNPFGVLRSKATGEPAFTMSIVVIFALRHALDSSRSDAGVTEKWFKLGAPTTPDIIFLNSGNSVDSYALH